MEVGALADAMHFGFFLMALGLPVWVGLLWAPGVRRLDTWTGGRPLARPLRRVAVLGGVMLSLLLVVRVGAVLPPDLELAWRVVSMLAALAFLLGLGLLAVLAWQVWDRLRDAEASAGLRVRVDARLLGVAATVLVVLPFLGLMLLGLSAIGGGSQPADLSAEEEAAREERAERAQAGVEAKVLGAGLLALLAAMAVTVWTALRLGRLPPGPVPRS